MKQWFGKAFRAVRETVSGRRRVARYSHPDAHRAGGRDMDAGITHHYRPGPRIPGGPSH
ncbi:hypothetical protein SAMN05216223_107239 [Actinacidiphila yanglinensis]|uniref:Uncharacterized protein n=1 Tax=Actinacidiphila yanglinensis TaxID=310779 RepID=A0A1H6BU78_9ACTN|nr:hypothetical protein [Actinacidiphila yanglinensis]SEG64213.1 hypothetical protein SAMN05216223_107239 [Actinacidiphila yanglinensis]